MVATVVVLPDTEWAGRADVLAGVTGGVDVQGASATQMCADLLRVQPESPLVVVAHGSACAVLPAIALAQRAAHRRVDAYVVVEPHAPASTDTWPDAPVLAVTNDDHTARLAALRGWTTTNDDAVTAILRVVDEMA